MKKIVLKFGGSSVETIEKMNVVAERIIARVKNGENVVVVVSAMGKTTNNLFSLARSITKHPNKRDLDLLLATGEITSIALLSIILNAKGYKSISLTGPQAKIETSGGYTCSKITNIDTSVILKYLNEGYIVIVAGYQGVNSEGDFTTLGREGSDTSAVNLAYYLNCPCEIYTDVDGVYFVDPRIYENKIIHPCMCYHDMLLLSMHGAKVLATSAIELASMKKVPLKVTSTYNYDAIGTTLKANCDFSCSDLAGIAILDNVKLIKVKSGLSLEQLKKFQSLGIKVDNIDLETVSLSNDDRIFLDEAINEVLDLNYLCLNDDIVKVSLIGRKCNDCDFIENLLQKIKKSFNIIESKHITNRLSIFINKEKIKEIVTFMMKNIELR